MRFGLVIMGIIALCSCVEPRSSEDPTEWYDDGVAQPVEEYIAFTETNYDFPAGDGDTVDNLLSNALPGSSFDIAFEPGIDFTAGDCSSSSSPGLPQEIEGIVTLHPRLYIKSSGCDNNSDEKYYGSYFIQDKSGGIFVLGDSKVAHFVLGDRVRLKVRATRNSFDLPMIYAHDVISVDRGPYEVYYQERTTSFGNADIGQVWRVTGTVSQIPDNFGEFKLKTDENVEFTSTFDSEISRRGLTVSIGDRVQITGPLLYSYSSYTLVVMMRGQVKFLD